MKLYENEFWNSVLNLFTQSKPEIHTKHQQNWELPLNIPI